MSSSPSAAERVQVWLRSLARDRATSVVPVPGGIGLRHKDFPNSHDHNRLLLWSPAPAEEVAAAADDVLADCSHRLVDVQGIDLSLPGYEVSHEVVLELAAAPPPLPHVSIETLSVDERAQVAAGGWRIEQPTWPGEVCRELGDRVQTLAGAVDATFLGVRGTDGEVVAHADVFWRNGIAQIEEVMTDDAVRGRGYASALLAEACALARSHADLVFLVADADDWPQTLYRRRGFVDQQVLTSLRATPSRG